MADNPRIEELRRRVQKDPASIAFAQLAEEYRRAGNYEDAIAICRTGLQTHPSYLSARVTLGRALLEMNELEKAEVELRYVLQHAAENLAAIRALAEIHHRRGELKEALVFYKSALELARHDPDLEQTVNEISRAVASPPPPAAKEGLSFEPATADFLSSMFDGLEPEPSVAPAEDMRAGDEASGAPREDEAPVEQAAPVEAVPVDDATPVEEALSAEDALFLEEPSVEEIPAMAMQEAAVNPALPSLERFLEVIHTYRQRRAV